MKQRTIETLGFAINGMSIVMFFYWSATLDVSEPSVPVRVLAWIILAFGFALIVLSITTLIRNSETGLIDRGIYGIVRHPMYAGAMLAFLSWIFFLPHWIIFSVSLVNIAIVYAFVLQGERQNLTKFGDAYKRYMETVPRINPFVMIIRRLGTK